MAANQKLTARSALPPNPTRRRRFVDYLERAFAHLRRKPEHLYAVRYDKVVPMHERHLAENYALLRQGAKLDDILDSMEAQMAELEALRPDDLPRRAFPIIPEALRDEVESECRANHLQLVASQTLDPADLDRAIEAGDHEVRATKALNRAFRFRRDNLRLLRNQTGVQVGSRSALGRS